MQMPLPQIATAGRLPFTQMFAFETLGVDRFRSDAADGRKQRVFGGQLLGQALAASLLTVPVDRPAHAFQVQFRAAGASDLPFDFAVERVAEGRSFSSRQVRVTQGEKLVLLAMASFHVAEEGLAFQPDMPAMPRPEDMRSAQDLRAETILAAGGSEAKAHALNHLGFVLYPAIVQNVLQPEVKPPFQKFWVRPVDAVPSDPAQRQAMIAYLTDIMFLATVLHPHGRHWLSTPMDWASLNHSLWLHAGPDFSDWLLWSTEAVWTGGARGLAHGNVFNRNGQLVASAAQEGLMRVRR